MVEKSEVRIALLRTYTTCDEDTGEEPGCDSLVVWVGSVDDVWDIFEKTGYGDAEGALARMMAGESLVFMYDPEYGYEEEWMIAEPDWEVGQHV